MCFVYPAADGVIDTIQWEGFREGVDDVRYLSTLLKAMGLSNRLDEIRTSPKAKLVQETRQWLEDLDPFADLDALREEMARRTAMLLEMN